METDGGRATVLMSGGVDSAACAYFLRSQGMTVDGIFVDYGQAAALREAHAVAAVANYLALPMRQIRLLGTDPCDVGEVLGRNAFLLFAALVATRGRSELLALGVHAGTPYYDCSPAFVEIVGKAIAEHTDGRVSVVAPFVTWTKKDVFDYFRSAHLPVALTYSCEAGTEPTCGVCASCRDRKALGC